MNKEIIIILSIALIALIAFCIKKSRSNRYTEKDAQGIVLHIYCLLEDLYQWNVTYESDRTVMIHKTEPIKLFFNDMYNVPDACACIIDTVTNEFLPLTKREERLLLQLCNRTYYRHLDEKRRQLSANLLPNEQGLAARQRLEKTYNQAMIKDRIKSVMNKTFS